MGVLPQISTQTQLKEVYIEVADDFSASDFRALIASLPNTVQKLKFASSKENFEQMIVILLSCPIQYIYMFCRCKVNQEILSSHLDANQQSYGNRTREINGFKFQVSANNKILKMQQFRQRLH